MEPQPFRPNPDVMGDDRMRRKAQRMSSPPSARDIERAEEHISSGVTTLVGVFWWAPLVLLVWHFASWQGVACLVLSGLVHVGMEFRRAWKVLNG